MADEHAGAGELEGLLTDAEHTAHADAGRLYRHIADHVVGHGPTREDDLRECRWAVHIIQRMVLVQAAARLYPHTYRLLGEVLNGTVMDTADGTGSRDTQ